jgi:putative oxidoreductase
LAAAPGKGPDGEARLGDDALAGRAKGGRSVRPDKEAPCPAATAIDFWTSASRRSTMEAPHQERRCPLLLASTRPPFPERMNIMNIKRAFTVTQYSSFADVALLLLRIVAGLAFMFHGWGKIQNPFGWMGPEAPVPGILQGLAALSEFGGGLAWILGLLTPLASLGLAITMTVAVAMHAIMRGDPFVSATGGPSYELSSVYLCIALLLIAAGPGRLSLDRKIFGPR